MAFVKLATLPTKNTKSPVRLSLTTPGGGDKIRVSVSVDGWLLAKLGPLKKVGEFDGSKEKYEIQIGTGEDAGKMRIKRDGNGVATPRLAPKGDTYLFRLGYLPEFQDVEPQKALLPCAYKTVDEWTLELAAPNSLFSAETQAPQAVQPAAPVVTIPANPRAPRISYEPQYQRVRPETKPQSRKETLERLGVVTSQQIKR